MNIRIMQSNNGMFLAEVQVDEGTVSGHVCTCLDGAIEALCYKLRRMADEIEKQTEA